MIALSVLAAVLVLVVSAAYDLGGRARGFMYGFYAGSALLIVVLGLCLAGFLELRFP